MGEGGTSDCGSERGTKTFADLDSVDIGEETDAAEDHDLVTGE